MPNYDSYNIAINTSLSTWTISNTTKQVSAGTIVSVTGGISANGGDTILQSGSTFHFNSSPTTRTYYGTASYVVSGTSYTGFIVSVVNNGTTQYRLIVPAGQTIPAVSHGGSYVVGGTSGSPATGDYDVSQGYTLQCFLQGTLVATPEGERLVEALAAGDLVLTADGRAVPVRWVGQSIVSLFTRDRERLLPVRIKAGALAENLPARDLVVSPGHGMLVDGVLAHAGALVNGTSIVRDADAPLVFSYFHLELDTHEIILAEGAPTESFLESAEDAVFVNAAERVAPTAVAELSYPRVKSPRQLPRETRARLSARAAELAGETAAA